MDRQASRKSGLSVLRPREQKLQVVLKGAQEGQWGPGDCLHLCTEDTGFLGLCPKAAELAGPQAHGGSASGDSELWVPDVAGTQGNEGSGREGSIHVRVAEGRQPAPPFTAGPERGQPETPASRQEMLVLRGDTGLGRRLRGPDRSSCPHTRRPLMRFLRPAPQGD